MPTCQPSSRSPTSTSAIATRSPSTTVSFTVEQGEIFGIIGPNGAGKTTTVECVEGLRRPDRGSISVLGLDPQRDAAALRQRLGVQLQQSDLPDRMRVTHFMEEAEHLCDRLAVIDSGRVVALDTPAGLVATVDPEQRLRFRLSSALDDRVLMDLPEVHSVTKNGAQFVVTGNGNVLQAVTSVLARHQIVVSDLRMEQTSLDDAFVALTGRGLDN